MFSNGREPLPSLELKKTEKKVMLSEPIGAALQGRSAGPHLPPDSSAEASGLVAFAGKFHSHLLLLLQLLKPEAEKNTASLFLPS